jgi:hypothetical protein
LWDYCVGLVLPCERKSVEPMAAVTAPERVSAQHQSLLHFVNQAPWLDDHVLAKVREMVVPAIERHGPIEAWIIDDTGLPKRGHHSVGVAHQYCGQLGKQANCQVALHGKPHVNFYDAVVLVPSAREPHNRSMANAKPKVEFEPAPMKSRSGWYVLVTLPSGVRHHLGGFKTEEEARVWIAVKSAAWLKEYENGKYA